MDRRGVLGAFLGAALGAGLVPRGIARAEGGAGVLRKAYVRMDLLQKAAVAAVIAFVLFYPKTLAMVYEKLPQLEAFDPFLRTFLLAVVLYLIMWKFNI